MPRVKLYLNFDVVTVSESDYSDEDGWYHTCLKNQWQSIPRRKKLKITKLQTFSILRMLQIYDTELLLYNKLMKKYRRLTNLHQLTKHIQICSSSRLFLFCFIETTVGRVGRLESIFVTFTKVVSQEKPCLVKYKNFVCVNTNEV